MSPPVTVSVILTAFQRREFVRDAIESVMPAGEPTSETEVCLVTNLAASELPPSLPRTVTVIRDLPQNGMGAWFRAGLESTHGDVVAFLDDDDTFAAGKVASVRAEFAADPELGFLHNGRTDFSGAGAPSASGVPRTRAGATLRVREGEKGPDAVERLWAEEAAFNSSSISMRRSVFAPVLSDLGELEGGPGAFLLFAALASPGTVVSDPRPLTRYRVHAGNQSPTTASGSLVRLRRGYRLAGTRIHDVRLTLAMVQRLRPSLHVRPLQRALLRSEWLLRLGDPRLSRSGADQLVRELWEERRLGPTDPALWAAALLGLVAPPWAGRMVRGAVNGP
jgi:hypothetical protein